MNVKTTVLTLIIAFALIGTAAAYGTATVTYNGNDGDITIATYAPNVYDVQTCNFDGSVNGYQTVTETGPNWRGDDRTTIERITSTVGNGDIETSSYIMTPCGWDEDGMFIASVNSDTAATLSQLGSAQGKQNSHQQPKYLQFGYGTVTGVTDLYADGEYNMVLNIAQFVPGGITEAEAYITMDGVTADTAYLGTARVQLGDGYACHGTGFRNYYPGYSNELPGFMINDPDGYGTVEISAYEGKAVWGAPYLQVQTSVTNDGITTITDVNEATGYVYQVYTFEEGITGEGHLLAH